MALSPKVLDSPAAPKLMAPVPQSLSLFCFPEDAGTQGNASLLRHQSDHLALVSSGLDIWGTFWKLSVATLGLLQSRFPSS